VEREARESPRTDQVYGMRGCGRIEVPPVYWTQIVSEASVFSNSAGLKYPRLE
jgi:hypothetical protein